MTSNTDVELPHPILTEVLAYWQRQCGGRAMPSPRDIDPLGLGAKLLPHIVLVDVEPDGDFRYRLVGATAVSAVGRNAKGQLVSSYHPNPAYSTWLIALYRRVLAGKRPIYSESIFKLPDGRNTRVNHRLLCPLSADGATVDRLLAAQVFVPDDRPDLPGTIEAVDFTTGAIREL